MAVQAEEVMDDRALNESMDEDIRSTLADINARNETDTAADAPDLSTAPSQEGAEVQPVADGRARDESGKFVAKDKTEQPAALEQASQPNAQEATAPAAAAPTEPLSIDGKPLDVNRPPSSWKPAAKAAYAALTPEQRKVLGEEIYRRESDFHKGNSAIKENADFGQNIRTKFEPYKMLMQAEGSTPEAGIDEYLRSAALLRVGTPQQKLDLIKQIDAQFNCGLGQDVELYVQQRIAQVTGQPAPAQAQQPQQFQDPRVDALLKSQEQEQQRRAQELSAQAGDAETKFRAATDEAGQLKYPFVDNVESDMISRIPELRRQNPALPHIAILEQAYDAAVWANPETRAVLLSQQAAKANQPAETQRRVEAARRANAVNVPKRGAIPASQASGHFALGTPESDESIKETYRQLQAAN